VHEPVIVFDAECIVCSGWVDFILRRDRSGRFRFASMQGKTGRALLTAAGLDPADPSTMLLCEGHAWRTDTEAILRIIASFGGPWRLLLAARIIPRAWRDAAYRWVARNRYRIFGRRNHCLVPGPDIAHRFLP